METKQKNEPPNEWQEKPAENIVSLTAPKKYSGKVSALEFIVLDLATFGVYVMYWCYRQWQTIKAKRDGKFNPAVRGIFTTIFLGNLAKTIKEMAKEQNIEVTYHPYLLWFSFIFLYVLYKLPDPYWLIAVFDFLPLLPILRAMNQYYDATENGLEESELSWHEKLLITIGLLFFGASIFLVLAGE